MTERIKDVALLETLCGLFGPSGCEGEVADWIEARVRPICDRLERDRMGNVIALIRGGGPAVADQKRMMLSAHMDEVGFMITELCEDGMLRFDTVGGFINAVLEGRKIVLGDESHRVRGVIASKAIHHKEREDRNKTTPTQKMYMDIGATERKETEQVLSVGEFAVFDSPFYRFGKDGAYLKGKALDDRLGCAVLIEVMESLMEKRPETDLDYYFCFTVREEIGLSGARVAAQRIAPDFAMVLECTAVADLADVEPSRRVATLGEGGALSVMDRSTVYDQGLLLYARELADEKGIPVQVKRYVSGGNDAGSIHKSGLGVRTLALSVPTRYLHSPACVCKLEDYRSVVALTEAMVRNMSRVTR